jgi:hypothetical protein
MVFILYRSTAPNELAKTFVVFVSNRKQVVPLWRQRAGRDEEKLVKKRIYRFRFCCSQCYAFVQKNFAKKMAKILAI